MSRSPEETQASIGCKAIPNLSSVLERALQPDGDISVQLEWFQKDIDRNLVSYSFGCPPSTAKSLDMFKRIRRSRESLCELELAVSLARRLHILLDAQYQAAKDKVNAVSLRVGLSSLPDEILSEVLVLATRPPYIPPYVDLHVAAEMQAIQEA